MATSRERAQSATQLQGIRERAVGGLNTEEHSYEQYAKSDASVGINSYSINKIGEPKHRVVDVGVGTGEVLAELVRSGKLAPGFQAVGLDIDRTGVDRTGDIFRNFDGQNLSRNVRLVQASGEHLPLSEDSADLITCLNTVHLLDNPGQFFDEAHRVLEDGGDLVINSAYVKGSLYANSESEKAVKYMLLGAAKYAKRKGHQWGAAFDPARFTIEEYEEMAKSAGFTDVKAEVKTVHMNKKDIAAIFSTEEFEDGALPGVPYHVTRRGLVGSIKGPMERFGLDAIDRNWVVITAKKTTPQNS